MTTLFLSFAGDAWRSHDGRQLPLILRCVKGAVEGGALDLAFVALLQLPHHRHHQVLIQHAIVDHPMLDHKTHRILNHEHIMTVLNRHRLLAAFDQLRVRLEDAEDLLVVGQCLAFKHSSPGVGAYLRRQAYIMKQQVFPLRRRYCVFQFVHGQRRLGHHKGQLSQQAPRPRQQILGQLQ